MTFCFLLQLRLLHDHVLDVAQERPRGGGVLCILHNSSFNDIMIMLEIPYDRDYLHHLDCQTLQIRALCERLVCFPAYN